MSLYTPVFPHTQPQPPESPSSSGSTSNNEARLTAVSYSSRLSELHLGLASLPAEICPASRESSPTSKSRSQALQSRIKDAVSKGRYTGDLCKTRYSRRGIGSMYTGLVAKGGATTEMEKVHYILPETEEEWFELERQRSESRRGRAQTRPTEKTSSTNGSTKTPLRDTILAWKAGVTDVSPDDPNKSNQFRAAPPNRTRSETAALGFPVVKRATLLKDGKGKRLFASSSQPSSGGAALHHQANRDAFEEEDTDQAGTSKLEVPSKESQHNQPTTSENRAMPRDESVIMPPPSFPQDLPTSTPRNAFKDSRREHDDARSDHDISLDNIVDCAPAQVEEHDIREDRGINTLRNPVQQNFSTPPSPPASNYSSPIRRGAKDRPVNSSTISSVPLNTGATGRPLTPVSVESEPPAHINAPRTPERSPLKKFRTESHIDRTSADGPSTPKSVINGLSRKKTLPLRTPEHLFVDLTASRRSLRRPRPPRQLAIQNFTASVKATSVGDNDGELSDASPAKSEKSFFSSPGSGSSEPSPAMTRYGANLLDSSPLAQFSQSPTRFAPMAESTQISLQGRFGDLRSSPTNTLTRATSKRSLIPHGSSGVIGMPFNSQYDVNGNIDQVSHLLEKDVDFGAWIQDADDAEGVQAEQITNTQVSVAE